MFEAARFMVCINKKTGFGFEILSKYFTTTYRFLQAELFIFMATNLNNL
jgi:hypothetical protein